MTRKIILAPALFFIIFAFASGPSAAWGFYIPNIFGGYVEGAESARAANYRDYANAQAIRAMERENNFNMYLNTGDFTYACIAYYQG